jgi:poly(beta-D-mannuronate) lyase
MNKIFLLTCLIIWQSGIAQKFIVKNIEELEAANKKALPGDTIILKNGEWTNSNVILTCEGNSDQPITIKAETEGLVKLTGRSSLQIGGKFLVVSGLNFSNGHSPYDEVINFRAKGKQAFNCRLTNTAIIDYNKPKRMEDDFWINLHGQNNRIDHCSFIDKKNMGVLVVVSLEEKASRENFDRQFTTCTVLFKYANH